MLTDHFTIVVGGFLCLVLVAVFILVLDAYRQRQWRRRMVTLAAQLDVFTEASVAVASTLQSLLLNPQLTQAQRNETVPKEHLYALARRRLANSEAPAHLQKELGLSVDELALLQVNPRQAKSAPAESRPNVVTTSA